MKYGAPSAVSSPTFFTIDPPETGDETVSQEMCVQRGGHCYDLTREHPDLLPGPCKHCGVRPVRGPTV